MLEVQTGQETGNIGAKINSENETSVTVIFEATIEKHLLRRFEPLLLALLAAIGSAA